MSAIKKPSGYVPDSKWHYSYYMGREFVVGWFYNGQLEKRNIVTFYEQATRDKPYLYTTDNGVAIPKKIARHLVSVLENMELNESEVLA